jgi:hypothetical protein
MFKIIINIIAVSGLVTLTILTYNKEVKFDLMINSSIYTESITLEERNNGLKGACLKHIVQHPFKQNELIAKGPAGNYFTNNNGENWRLLKVGNFKYAGELAGRAPNVYWDYEGRMITTIENSLYWSEDGNLWNIKQMDYPAEIIGLGDDKKLWLKGNRDDKEKTVFYAWLDWEVENEPEIKIRAYEDLKAKPVMISNLMFVASNWLIDNGLLYCRDTTANEWKEKSEGINRPVVHYFMQDKDDPEHLLIASSTNASFSGGFKDNREIVYWKSDDFGENWQQTDLVIFENWSLADTLLPDMRHCNLSIINNNAFIGKNMIQSNYYFIKAIEDVGWLDKTHFYSLGREGIQIGTGTKKCAFKEQVIWSWGSCNASNQVPYHLGALNDYARIYEVKVNDSLAEPDFVTKEYKKVATMVKNDTLELIIPCNYGGMWYAKVPIEHPLSFRWLLHVSVKNRLVIFLTFMYIIYVIAF